LVALSTPVFEQVEKFRVGQIHGRPTRSKICVGRGPRGSGAYVGVRLNSRLQNLVSRKYRHRPTILSYGTNRTSIFLNLDMDFMEWIVTNGRTGLRQQ